MNNYTKALIISSLFILPISSFAACNSQLNRTLKMGMKGDDVKVLQTYLNTNLKSNIKVSGVYDAATQKAFMSFQAKNNETILKPAGLKSPNGIVGVASRNMINKSICAAKASSTPEIKNLSDNEANAQIKMYEKQLKESDAKLNAMLSGLKNKAVGYKDDAKLKAVQDKVSSMLSQGIMADDYARLISDEMNKKMTESKSFVIYGITPTTQKQGGNIYVFGDSISASSKVYFGNRYVQVKRLKITDRFVVATIPSDLAAGDYDVYVDNAGVKSDIVGVHVLKADAKDTVSITSISPTKGNVETEVVITGSGFTKNNTILTTTKIFKNISSTDGKTIKFKIDAEKLMIDNNGKLLTTLPFNINIKNENGESNIVNFKLE